VWGCAVCVVGKKCVDGGGWVVCRVLRRCWVVAWFVGVWVVGGCGGGGEGNR